MSNSPLVDFVRISPNKSSPRTHKIDTITIHCVVGQCSVETIGAVFAPPARQASSNYGIGPDGRIGMYVEEKDRSWCTGGRDRYGNPIYVNGISGSMNDQRAITIEVASDTTHPYAVTDAAYNSLIELCADICRRNNIKELKWKADKSLVGHPELQNMTVHRWFANKACPGDYLYNRHGDIAKKVNAKLGVYHPENTQPEPEPEIDNNTDIELSIGDIIKLKSDAHYISGKRVPNWVINSTLYVRGINSNGSIIFSTLKKGAITGTVKLDQILIEQGNNSKQPEPYTVRVIANALNIRKGPGTNYPITGTIRNRGVYTIIDTQNNWGKLKSGAGWICLNYVQKTR